MAAATGTLETLKELQALVRSKEARLEQVPVEDTELRVEIRQDLLALRDLEVWVMHTGVLVGAPPRRDTWVEEWLDRMVS
uniref:Uncharacterized protein n=1 Tax=Tetradesmus obliquus TaxID=3088 RepID=A0A383VSY4_TETOB